MNYQTQAFEMVRKYGFVEALRLCKQYRDSNSPGTFSFAEHNAVLRKLEEFAAVGACYRKA